MQRANDRFIGRQPLDVAPLQAELEREKEVKALEAQRHQQEVEAAAQEAEEERRRHREAYLRCVLICSRHAVRQAFDRRQHKFAEGPRSELSLTADRVLTLSIAKTPAVARAALHAGSQWMTS